MKVVQWFEVESHAVENNLFGKKTFLSDSKSSMAKCERP